MLVTDITRVIADNGPQIAERLASCAMQWLLTTLAENEIVIDRSLMEQIPEVKMFTVNEIIEMEQLEYDIQDKTTIVVAYITDGTATEYIRINPDSGEIVTTFA